LEIVGGCKVLGFVIVLDKHLNDLHVVALLKPLVGDVGSDDIEDRATRICAD
jgi:hypothetical protein